jgi:ferredoxin
MGKQTIDHDRPTCIGCAACEAVAPDFWEMAEDGKSDVKGAERIMEGNEIVREKLEIEEKDQELNMDAAEACPVNCIHILDENGEKLI